MTEATPTRVLRDLEHVDEIERGLIDRLRQALTGLILARETEAHLQRRLDTLEGHANGRLRAALSADEVAQRCRDLLVSMPTWVELDGQLPPAAPGDADRRD